VVVVVGINVVLTSFYYRQPPPVLVIINIISIIDIVIKGGNKHARTTIRCGAINLHRTLFTPKGSFCAQVLRMQSLVFLTYLKSSRLNRAQHHSLCVLASPINYTASLNMSYKSLLDYDETPAYTESYVLLCNLETICATTITWTHHNLI